jgi:hypothetical protein
MPTATKKSAPKTTTTKKVVRVAKKTTGTKAAPKKAAPKTTGAKKAAPKKTTAKKSSWVTQSAVAYDPEIGASRFTTQTQRRLLREIVASGSKSYADSSAATGRSLARLVELGLATLAKNGTAKPTANGKKLVA